MNEINKWNVVFLIDSTSPSKVALLRRADTKNYAPGYYTGIGGKIGDVPGLENETPLQSAYRELEEEAGIRKEDIELIEFARCVYEQGLYLYYFVGVYKTNELPTVDPTDGTLEWVATEKLLDKNIIPTTHAVIKEWKQRDFDIGKPFTINLREKGKDGTVRLIELINTTEGLVE